MAAANRSNSASVVGGLAGSRPAARILPAAAATRSVLKYSPTSYVAVGIAYTCPSYRQASQQTFL